MATLMGDVFADSSRFHMMPGAAAQHPHPHPHPHETHAHYHSPRPASGSRERERDTPSHSARTSYSPRRRTSYTPPSARVASHNKSDSGTGTAAPAPTDTTRPGRLLPSPPSSSSSSSSAVSSTAARPQDGTLVRPQDGIPANTKSANSLSQDQDVASSADPPTVPAPIMPGSSQLIPSPNSVRSPDWDSPKLLRSRRSLEMADSATVPAPRQTTIHVRDLAHVKSLARADPKAGDGPGLVDDLPLSEMKYEISAMPIGDIIEMVAALLTKITTNNDAENKAQHRNAVHMKQIQAQQAQQTQGEDVVGKSPMTPFASSVLAFHGKNVPAITILSYLSRIHKYCPTTYEVFLSLLIYFDRMSDRVNPMVVQSEEARRTHLDPCRRPTAAPDDPDPDTVMAEGPGEDSDEVDSDLADDDDQGDRDATPRETKDAVDAAPADPTFFVVDSFNIHRLIIAGVTCASKFFSDVFYTNSRYAKVGGLPLAELNHLELQFLLLNDFRLAVPVEDLEAYATMLVEFHAREAVAQRARPVANAE